MWNQHLQLFLGLKIANYNISSSAPRAGRFSEAAHCTYKVRVFKILKIVDCQLKVSIVYFDKKSTGDDSEDWSIL